MKIAKKLMSAFKAAKKTYISYKLNKFIGINKKFNSRTYYNHYGKVLRVQPRSFFKKCLIFDTLVPLTFFIPVIFASLVFIFTLGREFMIDLDKSIE